MLLEICANSYLSAINAEKAGAHRIELCTELAVGGVTPSHGLIQKVMKNLSIPVHVLIRPRSGDFTYSDDEFEVMKQDIVFCKELGCAGIVSGVLLSDQSIDLPRTKELIELSKPMSFTFHRAFDWVPNPFEIITRLENIGVDRVLSSGQNTSAEKGIELLKKLQSQTDVIILPGGGINPKNAKLFLVHGFREIHCSATKQVESITIPKISMNSSKLFDETQLSYSDIDTIKNILQIIHHEN